MQFLFSFHPMLLLLHKLFADAIASSLLFVMAWLANKSACPKRPGFVCCCKIGMVYKAQESCGSLSHTLFMPCSPIVWHLLKQAYTGMVMTTLKTCQFIAMGPCISTPMSWLVKQFTLQARAGFETTPWSLATHVSDSTQAHPSSSLITSGLAHCE